MRKQLLIIAFVMVFSLIAVNTTMAGTATDNLVVTATVAQSCRITSMNNINFGAYDPTDPIALDEEGAINFRCVAGTNYNTYISGPKVMTNGVSDLTFQLYTDFDRTNPFPFANPHTPDTSGSNGVQTTSIYGRITPLQNVDSGNYSTTLTVNIEY